MTNPTEFIQKTFNGDHRFIRFSLADLIQIVVTLLVAAGVYFKLDNRVLNVETSIKENHDWIQRVDTDGSRQGQLANSKQEQMIIFNTHRLDVVELQLKEIGPKLDRIDANLNWLMTKNGGKP